MKGRWKVTSNPINGKTMYAAFRLADVLAVDHSGNREYASRDASSVWTEDRTAAQALADELNLQDIIERHKNGEDRTALMNEMERIFRIPAMNDESFNEKYPAVMELYCLLSNSRDI